MTPGEIVNATFDELRSYVPTDYAGAFDVDRIKLDCDGYSSVGAYYGRVDGVNLFTVWWTANGSMQCREVRCRDKKLVVQRLYAMYPKARILGHRRASGG